MHANYTVSTNILLSYLIELGKQEKKEDFLTNLLKNHKRDTKLPKNDRNGTTEWSDALQFSFVSPTSSLLDYLDGTLKFSYVYAKYVNTIFIIVEYSYIFIVYLLIKFWHSPNLSHNHNNEYVVRDDVFRKKLSVWVTYEIKNRSERASAFVWWIFQCFLFSGELFSSQ